MTAPHPEAELDRLTERYAEILAAPTASPAPPEPVTNAELLAVDDLMAPAGMTMDTPEGREYAALCFKNRALLVSDSGAAAEAEVQRLREDAR